MQPREDRDFTEMGREPVFLVTGAGEAERWWREAAEAIREGKGRRGRGNVDVVEWGNVGKGDIDGKGRGDRVTEEKNGEGGKESADTGHGDTGCEPRLCPRSHAEKPV